MAGNNSVTYTHFQLSPPKRPPTNRREGDETNSLPQYLTLGGPFSSSAPRLHFEKVQVGQSRVRTLIVHNTKDFEVLFRFLKMPSSAFEIDCQDNVMIPAKGKLKITVKWTPTNVGHCIEGFQCQSSLSGMRISIPLLGEAEPSHWKTKSFTGGFGRQNKAHNVFVKPPESSAVKGSRIEEKSVCFQDTSSILNSSPSRRETYLVPPTPNKTPRRKYTSQISGLTLDLDDDTDDDFKENDSSHAVTNSNFQGILDLSASIPPSFVESSAANMIQSLVISNPTCSENEFGKSPGYNDKATVDSKQIECHTSVMAGWFGDAEDLQDELLDKLRGQLEEEEEFLKLISN